MTTQEHITQTESTSNVAGAILCELQARGFRRTAALGNLIREMVAHAAPATLTYWASLPTLRELNPVTIYRLMMRLEQAGMVRRLHLGERAQCFQLIQPGPQPDYLVCTNCGELEPVQLPPELRSLEQRLALQSGWTAVRHELEFFGLCPDCMEHQGQPIQCTP